jgi:hypothetical protein
MELYAGNAEKMRITSGGNVLIGDTTDGGQKLQVTRANDGGAILRLQSTGGAGFDFSRSNTTGALSIQGSQTGFNNIVLAPTSGEVLVGGTTDNGAYNLQCNGTGVWGAGAYVNGSDRNIKDNISTIEKGLEYIEKMNPVRFKYKPNYTRDHTTQTGFIAQELQEVFADEDYLSGLVQRGVHLSVAYQNLLPILVKAIQELKQEIDTLKN